jgi:CAAX prenyl protease-like protein
MPSPSDSTRNIIAYVTPFAIFMAGTMLESGGWLGLGYETLYTLKTALVVATLWHFRQYYPPFSKAGLGLALFAGTIGCALWIVLAKLQAAIPGIQALLDLIQQGGRAGYDPFSGEGVASARVAFVVVRFVGLALVVPVMEEIFWRGFLARYLISDDFRSVPQGQFTRFSFAVVTLAFTAVHPEILAALVWGAMINVLYRKTANLWACVTMHAVTNSLLGAYILATKEWQLW